MEQILLTASAPVVLVAGCTETPAVRLLHVDHLGSTQVVTDWGGNIVRQMRYSAYGEIRGRFGPNGFSVAYGSDTRFEFTGYETDFAGLEYAGARFFDPELTQFASHDPAGQFASPYAYGPGDPINTTDPTGMLAEVGVDAAVSIDYSSALSSLISVAWSASIQALAQSGSVRAEAQAFDRSAAKGYGLVESGQSQRAGLDLENYAMDIVTAPFGGSTIGAAAIVVLALTKNWETVSGSDSQSSQSEGPSDFDRFTEFVRKQGVERTAAQPFVHEKIADKAEDIPQDVWDYEPGGIWNEITNADDLGFHIRNQRLPGGYHVTVDEVGGSVNLHFDVFDPTVSPDSFIRHMGEIRNAPQPPIHRNLYPNWKP